MTPVEEIKSKLSILEVVSQYIRVEKSGNQYKARCPFHNERTPSFYVSPARASYHCFGCGESGDIFSFVGKVEHVEFKDALKILADRAGVTLQKVNRDQDSKLLSILTLARDFYIQNLKQSINAKKYLHGRGVNDDSLGLFQVGYANNEWRDLYNFLKKNNFDDDDIVDSGLIIRTEEGKYYDRFRGRIMFPICNVSGTVVGFTGRILPEYDDGKTGKYVNTPETRVYHKGNILFNFDKAKKSIADKREAVLVEGQMDVVMSTQAGVNNVVAVSGTAFTENQVKTISRLSDAVVLAFDNDAAGHKAAEKAGIMCTYGGLEVYTVELLGKDVADMVVEDTHSWQRVLDRKVLLLDFYINESLKLELKNRISYIRTYIVPLLKAVRSPLEKDMNINKVSKALSIDAESVRGEVNNYISEYKEEELVPNDKNVNEEVNLELELAALEKFFKKENRFEIPEEMVEAKIIDLERKHALTEVYYSDLLNMYNKKVKEKSIVELKEKIKLGEDVENNLAKLQSLIAS